MPATRSSLLLQLGSESAENAWQEFLRIYRPLIDRAVRKVGVPPQDHEDAVQDVLMQLVKVLPTFSYQKRRGFFRHWLRHVTRNKAIDFRRRRSGVPVPSDQLDPCTVHDDPAAWLREFRQGLLQSAMTCVEPEFRPRTWQCFVLHVIEQRPAADTALHVGVSVNAVYVNASRVVARLREFCEFHGEEFVM